MESTFKKRIGFDGDLTEISKIICKDFDLGEFINYKVILIGYEDFNFSLETTKRKFLVKIFSKIKSMEYCKRNTDILVKSIESGISTPKLHKSDQGYLYSLKINQVNLRLIVMDFIGGEDFFTSKEMITKEDIVFLANQASLINSINIKPFKVYDTWAIPNLLLEYEKKSKYLDKEDLELIKPLVEEFKNLNLEELPHCFVHGDIIRTNTIKDKDNKIWIIDFSVSNYYPRIQELTILACDVLFNKNSKKESEENLKTFLKEYQKTIKLTPKEIEICLFTLNLPILCMFYVQIMKK